MIVGLVLLALVVGFLGRVLLARRARKAFCDGDCVTFAFRMNPNTRGTGWKHGYARLTPDAVEWRHERKLTAGADRTFDRLGLIVREHRPVVKGETMLSERCELIFAHYQGEPIELGVLAEDTDRFLGWLNGKAS